MYDGARTGPWVRGRESMSMKTRVTELLGIEVPVVQGAMARIADANLAGAVSEAGGLGIIACGGAPLDWVEEQVRIARSITDKPIGANVMLMDPNTGETAELLAKLRVDVITTGAGVNTCLQKSSPSAFCSFDLPVLLCYTIFVLLSKRGGLCRSER